MPETEEAATFLNGVTRDSDALYEHLTKVLLKITKESPENVFDSFESLSVQVKEETAGAASLNQSAETKEAEAVDQTPALEAAQKTLDLIKPPKKVPAGGDEDEEPEEEEEPEKAPIPDIMQDFGLLQWAGVGLEQEEMFRLMLSLQTLTTKSELQNVRFWGKINGTQKDYYIVEAKQEEYPEPEEGNEPPAKQEPLGTGTNECIYFATNSPEEPWTKLGVVQPEQIIAARNMRRFLTGNLEAPVLGFPRFPWGEGAYLRTQIARISADTTLAPLGQFTVEGDEGEETMAENEEWTGVNALVQDSAASWFFARSGIMSEGRTTPWVDPDKEEEEEEDEEEMSEEKKAALAAKEKPRRKLAAIGADAWSFRVQPSKYDSNAVSCAHSLQWPGAVSTARDKRVLNFYIGWGLEHSDKPYAPPLPPAFAAEYPTHEGEGEDPLLEQEDPMPPAGATFDEEEVDNDEDPEDEEAAPEGEGEGDEDE